MKKDRQISEPDKGAAFSETALGGTASIATPLILADDLLNNFEHDASRITVGVRYEGEPKRGRGFRWSYSLAILLEGRHYGRSAILERRHFERAPF